MVSHFKSSQQYRKAWQSGFNLVELTVSIAVVSVSLTLLLGLLPAGSTMIHNAQRQAEASRLLKQISTGLQAAALQDDGSYHVLGLHEMGEISWYVGDAEHPARSGWLNVSGLPTAADDTQADFVYRLEIHPPVDAWTSGRAVLRIAWPATSQWNDEQGWTRSQGNVRSLILFRPQ